MKCRIALVMSLIAAQAAWATSIGAGSGSDPIQPAAGDPVCSNGFALGINTIPENATEVAATTFACPGFAFGANVSVAVFFEPDGTTVSDIVALSDFNGIATVSFLSDADLPVSPPGPGFISIVEPNPFPVFAASTTPGGGKLTFSFASDVNESTTSSDTVTIALVPEPATFSLIGIALIAVSVVRARRKTSGKPNNPKTA